MDADETIALVAVTEQIGRLTAQLDETRSPAAKRILKHTLGLLIGHITPVVVIREDNVVPFPGGAG